MIRAGIIGSLNGLEMTVKSISSLTEYVLTGYYSNDQISYREDSPLHEIKQYPEPAELINSSEIIIITDQPGLYEDLIREILKNSKHIFIFTDLSLSIAQLRSFTKLAEEAGVLMFFHHDRYDFKWQEIIYKYFGKPEYIDDYICMDQLFSGSMEAIFNLFYRELFNVMRINPVNPRKFSVTTIPFYSPDPNFVNARIEFENGTSANITINKYSEGNKSRLDIFRHDLKAGINPLTGEVRILKDNSEIMHYSGMKRSDARREGLSQFRKHILSGNFISDLHEMGISAHRTAVEIINQLMPVPENSFH